MGQILHGCAATKYSFFFLQFNRQKRIICFKNKLEDL
jgi:hypothetical protein